jgi:hypothetical protein
MVSRLAWAIGLLVGLVGCVVRVIDVPAGCLEEHPGQVGCCVPGDHVSNGTCCPAGWHALSDVEHEDWRVCVPDEDPCADASACLDAGTDARADAGADGS